jgi:hypothetical protein
MAGFIVGRFDYPAIFLYCSRVAGYAFVPAILLIIWFVTRMHVPHIVTLPSTSSSRDASWFQEANSVIPVSSR